MIIFLDESGDLGFDFEEKSPSSHFVITLLVCESKAADDSFKTAVKRCLKNKLNHAKSRRKVEELHAVRTSLAVKQYFYRQIKNRDWRIYSLIINKRRVYDHLRTHAGKKKLYNYLANKLLDRVDFSSAGAAITLVVDKCKNRSEIVDFNNYLEGQLSAKLPLEVQLNIYHEDSRSHAGLQAVDSFCWGIYRKYEWGDTKWYDCYREQIEAEVIYFEKG